MTTDFAMIPEGSKWHRCALQVNPFSYLEANGKSAGQFEDEAAYNDAMVGALVQAGVTAVAIADHWCVDSGESLLDAALASGITVFPGFEATTKEGVHLLVLFDPSADRANINRYIGQCGIPAECRQSRPGTLDTLELLRSAEEWGAVTIAPHVTTGGGLLNKLSGDSAAQAWKDSRLHAVGMGGATPTQGQDAILANRDRAYRRANPLAILGAADISSPADVFKPGSSCWIKLSSLTVSGLDLAFRTPETRVARNDPTASAHPRIMGISWEGGFLDGVKIRLNESLNVLIGGRGSGKSTVIESLRFALGLTPLTPSSLAEHEALVKDVLRPGTRVCLELEVRTPSRARYTIERSVGQVPIVRDPGGAPLSLAPGQLTHGTQVFGQRELAELARDKQQLTALLAQHLPGNPGDDADPSEIQRSLERSRRQVLAAQKAIRVLDERLARLPVVEERLTRFDDAGVSEKLREQDCMQKEDQLLTNATTSVQEVPERLERLTVDTGYLAEDQVEELPRAALLGRVKTVLYNYNTAADAAMATLAAARAKAISDLDALRLEWDSEATPVREALDKVLRELQPSGVDGGEYLRLRKERDALVPLSGDRLRKVSELEGLVRTREALLVAAEGARTAQLRQLRSEAKKVGKSLPNVVRARVQDGEDRSPLMKLLDKQIGGRLDLVRTALAEADAVSPRTLAHACRKGADAIRAAYPSISTAQAAQLAGASEEALMIIEELALPVSTDLELNVGTKKSPIWRSLDHLSTGQRATALLLLLMHRGDGPLIIDQPEDDLDNRFIHHDIVPRIRKAKSDRQLIFSSHNANIPVLGDADQIVTLVAEDIDDAVTGRIAEGGLGSIDREPVRIMVEELLEGGRDAFNTRRYLYGF